jgi:hypothetical protein
MDYQQAKCLHVAFQTFTPDIHDTIFNIDGIKGKFVYARQLLTQYDIPLIEQHQVCQFENGQFGLLLNA